MLGKDKLVNLKLTVSFLVTGRYFRKLKVNLSKLIGFDDIFALSCQQPKKVSRKIA